MPERTLRDLRWSRRGLWIIQPFIVAFLCWVAHQSGATATWITAVACTNVLTIFWSWSLRDLNRQIEAKERAGA